MAAPATQNPPLQPASSKTSKKKSAVATPVRMDSPAPSVTNVNSENNTTESLYRELQKNIRNLSKKIANATKTEAVVSEHKDKSLDELVSARIINIDQKAQLLKKPQLESQLVQLEEQLAQYLKLEADFNGRLGEAKSELEKSFAEKLSREKEDAVREVQEKAAMDAKTRIHNSLLLVSQFLRLAAARRAEDADPTLDENMALEGILLHVYGGDENAVSTMAKLVQGADEPAPNTSGEPLKTTYAQVKAAIEAYVPQYLVDETKVESAATDPTIANATVNELAEEAALNGTSTYTSIPANPPANTSVADDAANAAAENQWDTNKDVVSPITSQEWISVSHESASIGAETIPVAGAAATTSEQPAECEAEAAAFVSESVPAAAAADAGKTSEAGDGFHQVQRHHRGGREGGWRGGRGRGGEWRGRGGFRGDRGRGHRGGPRGGTNGHRGPRRPEEAAA